jgi:hypothetical protein
VRGYGPRALTVILGLALAGCSSPQRKLTQGSEAALSWSATVHEVVRQWTGRLVPTAFAKTALQAAQQSLEQERTTLAASPKDMADEKIAAAAALMGSMSATVARMSRAVDAADGAGLLREEAALYEAEGRLKAVLDGSGG